MSAVRRTVPVFVLETTLILLIAGPAFANRCGNQNPSRCGVDSSDNPISGCSQAGIADLPLYRHTNACRRGETMVIYDIGHPFPDNGFAGDHVQAGNTSFMTVRAGDHSACAHMIDTVDPKPCPDPKLCPDPASPQPEGAIKVPVTGYVVGCWSPPDGAGCRTLSIHTKSMCLHAQHQLLGPGCTKEDDIDCANVSVEQVAIDVPGAKNRRLCPPTDPATSCRGTRFAGDPGLRFWIGGFCSTQNCANPGTSAPTVDPDKTCKTAWGATMLGYNTPPSKGVNAPGWYDWKTGAFEVDVTSPKPTCGDLGRCLGERTGAVWDLSVVAVPRAGQQVPCVGESSSCDAAACFQ
jgi:hypothetical protein